MVKYPSPLITSCGCSSMVEYQPSKLVTWVRFPSPAPRWSKVRFAPAYFFTCGRIISHPPASLRLLFRKKSRFIEINCAHSDLYYKNQSFAPLFLLTLQSRKDFAETPTYTCSVVTPSQRLAVATNLLRIFYRRIYNHIFFIVLRQMKKPVETAKRTFSTDFYYQDRTKIIIESNMDYQESQRLFIDKAANFLKQGGYMYLDFLGLCWPRFFCNVSQAE